MHEFHSIMVVIANYYWFIFIFSHWCAIMDERCCSWFFHFQWFIKPKLFCCLDTENLDFSKMIMKSNEISNESYMIHWRWRQISAFSSVLGNLKTPQYIFECKFCLNGKLPILFSSHDSILLNFIRFYFHFLRISRTHLIISPFATNNIGVSLDNDWTSIECLSFGAKRKIIWYRHILILRE